MLGWLYNHIITYIGQLWQGEFSSVSTLNGRFS